MTPSWTRNVTGLTFGLLNPEKRALTYMSEVRVNYRIGLNYVRGQASILSATNSSLSWK